MLPLVPAIMKASSSAAWWRTKPGEGGKERRHGGFLVGVGAGKRYRSGERTGGGRSTGGGRVGLILSRRPPVSKQETRKDATRKRLLRIVNGRGTTKSGPPHRDG